MQSSRTSARLDVDRHAPGRVESFADELAVEEPLEIRVEGPTVADASLPALREAESTGTATTRVAVTMRTPGHDEELAIGFLRTEGLITSAADLARGASGPHRLEVVGAGQVVTVRLRQPFDASTLARNFYASSSCGVCGKAALEHIRTASGPVGPGPRVTRATLLALPAALAAAQPTFERTGGLHATALFTAEGRLLFAREDVGRHNAMDKVIGRALLDDLLPLGEHVLLVSGRASFELVQKAAMAGATVLCAVSAPSSLAVALAEEVGMTLIGFLRGDRFNVYAGRQRVALD